MTKMIISIAILLIIAVYAKTNAADNVNSPEANVEVQYHCASGAMQSDLQHYCDGMMQDSKWFAASSKEQQLQCQKISGKAPPDKNASYKDAPTTEKPKPSSAVKLPLPD